MNPAPEPSGKSAENQHKIRLVIVYMLVLVIVIILLRPPFPKPAVPHRPEVIERLQVQKVKKTEGYRRLDRSGSWLQSRIPDPGQSRYGFYCLMAIIILNLERGMHTSKYRC
jgi:hypothetical protein